MEDEEALRKKRLRVAIIVVGIFFIACLCAGLTFYYFSIKNKVPPLRERTEAELIEVQQNYLKNFRPGCSLKDPSVFTWTDGVKLSGYFATCSFGSKRTYNSGISGGRKAIFESVSGSSTTIPVIVIYNQLVDKATSTNNAIDLATAYGEREKEIAAMTEAEKEKQKSFREYFTVAGNYVVLLRAGTDGFFFDQTSLSVTYVPTKPQASTKK